MDVGIKRSTGINGLDLALDGGYPTGTRIVVISSPLVGADLMARQFWKAEEESGTYLMIDGEAEPGMVDVNGRSLREVREAMTGSRIIVDSLSTLIQDFGAGGAIEAIMTGLGDLLDQGSNILYILYAGLHTPRDEIKVIRTADVVIVLREVIHGNEFERTLAVQKIKGMRIPGRVVPFNITEKGLELSTTSRVI